MINGNSGTAVIGADWLGGKSIGSRPITVLDLFCSRDAAMSALAVSPLSISATRNDKTAHAALERTIIKYTFLWYGHRAP